MKNEIIEYVEEKGIRNARKLSRALRILARECERAEDSVNRIKKAYKRVESLRVLEIKIVSNREGGESNE